MLIAAFLRLIAAIYDSRYAAVDFRCYRLIFMPTRFSLCRLLLRDSRCTRRCFDDRRRRCRYMFDAASVTRREKRARAAIQARTRERSMSMLERGVHDYRLRADAQVQCRCEVLNKAARRRGGVVER